MMDEDTADTPTSLVVLPSQTEPTIELAIAAWLDAKGRRSNSERTRDAYERTLWQFRAALRTHGLDLDSETAHVALVAQAWASQRERHTEKPIAAATYNLRLNILSSFYGFAKRRRLLRLDNPVELLEKRPTQGYVGALPLDFTEVQRRMAAIDRSYYDGLRDYALLLVGLHTGRRASELAGLRWQDVRAEGDRVTLTFRRCKGGKVMTDNLSPHVAAALMRWLESAYGGARLDGTGGDLDPEAPIWLALDPISVRTHRERPISAQAISALCEKHLGTSKVHALRHTFAHAMEEVGAKVSEIQARLGHSSLQTTSRYLQALHAAENPYAVRLEALYGVAAG